MKLVPNVNTEEIEIFAENSKYGFNVTVIYNKDDWRFKYNPQVHHNVTEVHWLYNKEDEGQFTFYKPGVAIESDIHNTGGTRELESIEYILIEVATELNSHH